MVWGVGARGYEARIVAGADTTMLEAGCVDRRLLLDDPLAALRAWSCDVPLAAAAPLADGGHRTAIELQMEFLEAASRFAAKGGFDGIVPHADHVLALWDGTLTRLAARNLDDLSQRVDWVAKYRLLTGVLEGSTVAVASATGSVSDGGSNLLIAINPPPVRDSAARPTMRRSTPVLDGRRPSAVAAGSVHRRRDEGRG